MGFNIEAGYGKLSQMTPFSPAGQIFVVGKAGLAGIDLIKQRFKPAQLKTRYVATLSQALANCVANRGDTIYLAPGHTEEITAATGIDVNKDGVTIIGVGNGEDKPTFTFSTATGASIDVTADSVKMTGIRGLAGIDSLTKPFNVTGDEFYGEIEWDDASASVEAQTAVRLDGVDTAYLMLTYRGFGTGDALDSAVLLDGCSNVRIDLDAYGVNSNAWVEMVDVASTNVVVTGKAYTQGVTDNTQLVVDTITGSTWAADLFDLSAGYKVSGGSGSALAADDVSAIATSVTAISNAISGAGIGSYPSAAVPANGVSLAAALRSVHALLDVSESTGEADIDVSESDYTAPTQLLTIVPNSASPLRDVQLHIDLDKATTGWADVATTETIQFYVLRKIDGTNYRAEPAVLASALAGNNADDQGVKIDIGSIGPDEEVAIFVELSVEPGSDVELPYALYYSGNGVAAPTITPVAAA